MANLSSLRLCSYNCRSVKNSLHDVAKLCIDNDILLFQEHWLLSADLPMLNNIHTDFLSYGLSAIDITKDILVGRPFGGTAILYKKSLAHNIDIIESRESRITGIKIHTNCGSILILNVYMPTNYNDCESLEAYIDCLCNLHAILVDCSATNVIISGDFNCSFGSRFFAELEAFVRNNHLIMSDIQRLANIHAYYSDDGTRMSWIDHIICSPSVDTMLSDIRVRNDIILSDHRPLLFTLQCSVSEQSADKTSNSNSDARMPLWQRCDDNVIYKFQLYLDGLLQDVIPPHASLLFSDLSLDSHSIIDTFYNDIIHCLQKAVRDVVPSRQCTYSELNMPGWNMCVSDKHDTARAAFLDWVAIGKPKSGHEFVLMPKHEQHLSWLFAIVKIILNNLRRMLVLMHYWIKTVINFGILCIKSAKSKQLAV